MENDLNGRQPQWKMTAMEEELNGSKLNGRQTQWKATSMEDELNGRPPQWR